MRALFELKQDSTCPLAVTVRPYSMTPDRHHVLFSVGDKNYALDDVERRALAAFLLSIPDDQP